MTIKVFTLLLTTLTLATHVGAQERLRVGLLPFDVANVDGGSSTAATALAKLIRAQLITNKRVQPILLEVPGGAKLPLGAKHLAALAEENDLQLIVAGTVLEATQTRSSNRVYTPRIPGGSVGGSMQRTRAEVKMHVELAGRDGEVTETFGIEASNTDVGVGTDIWTAVGGFDVGDSGWDKSPMGKALKEAAEKLSAEVVKRKAR